MALKLPSQKSWLNLLGVQHSDLNSIVGDIRQFSIDKQIFKDLLKNPFQKIDGGILRFTHFPSDFEDNLFRVFDGNFSDLVEYLELLYCFKDFHINPIDSRQMLVCNVLNGKINLTQDYPYDKLFLYPDTNIELDPVLKKYFRSLSKKDGIEYDILDIVNYEKNPGGLRMKFKNLVPGHISSGQQTLEKRLNLTYGENIEKLFDVIKEVYDEEICHINNLVRKLPRNFHSKSDIEKKKFQIKLLILLII